MGPSYRVVILDYGSWCGRRRMRGGERFHHVSLRYSSSWWGWSYLLVTFARGLTGNTRFRPQIDGFQFCRRSQSLASRLQTFAKLSTILRQTYPKWRMPGRAIARPGMVKFFRLGLGQTGLGAKLVRLVGALPGEGVAGAAEVAVGGGRLVHRAAQLEVAQDRARAQVEVLLHQLGDGLGGDLLGAEGLDQQRERAGDADRVGHLDLGPVGAAGRGDGLGHLAGGGGARAAALGGALPRDRAPAAPGNPAVGVNDDLPAGQAGVADRAADHEPAGRVAVELVLEPGRVVQVLRQHLGDDLFPQRLGELGLDPVLVLGGDEHLLDLDRLARVVVADRHLGLAVRAEVGQQAGVAHLRQLLGQLVGQDDRGRHQLGRLVGGVGEHHALVARADPVQRIFGAADPSLVRGVHALRDVRRLPVHRDDHADRVAVEEVLAVVVANVADDLPRDRRVIDR